VWPWALAGAGVVTTVIFAAVPPDPASLDERVALANAHNEQLAARLGFRPAPHSLNLRAASLPNGEGALMIATGSF
jgi:hypothetical protein